MSTRATYLFKPANDWTPDVCLYVHHDGYPQGAAGYFYNALCRNTEQESGGLLGAFMRANVRAEVTCKHEGHGDTEWRYTVTGNGAAAEIKVHERVRIGQDEWKLNTCGTLGEWLAAVASNSTGFTTTDLEWSPFREVKARYGRTQFLNAITACPLLSDRLKMAKLWTKNGANKGRNWDELLEDLNMILHAFPELDPDNVVRDTYQVCVSE